MRERRTVAAKSSGVLRSPLTRPPKKAAYRRGKVPEVGKTALADPMDDPPVDGRVVMHGDDILKVGIGREPIGGSRALFRDPRDAAPQGLQLFLDQPPIHCLRLASRIRRR